MKIAVVKETMPGERRVALVPSAITQLNKAGCEVLVERQAGEAAGFLDAEYEEKGATLVDHATAMQADVVLQVRALGANPQSGRDDLAHLTEDQTVIAMCDPLGAPEAIREIADTGARLFALEMIPRITRAQSMDVLSSMATVAGYRAVLLAAAELPKMFPLMMTAAGTLSPARAFVIGAGVAGCKPSPPPNASGRSSRPTMCDPPSANKSKAWAASSSNCNSIRANPKTPADTPKRWARSSTTGSAN